MKKNVRMLALTLVVAIALVGAGYAAWGTRITTTTALNSGEWNIVLENDSQYSYWAGDLISNFTKEGSRELVPGIDGAIGAANYTDAWGSVIDRSTGDYDVTNDVVASGAYDYVYTLSPQPQIPGGIEGAANAKVTSATFGFYNLHPGTRAYTRYEIRNDGSIPAKIGDVKVEILNENGESFGTIPQNVQEVIDAMVVNPVFAIHNGTGGDTNITIAPTTLNGLQAALKAALVKDSVQLLPDNKLYSYIVNADGSDELETSPDSYDPNKTFNFELPGKALTGNIGMNAKFQVKISLDFVQYNEVIAAN